MIDRTRSIELERVSRKLPLVGSTPPPTTTAMLNAAIDEVQAVTTAVTGPAASENTWSVVVHAGAGYHSTSHEQAYRLAMVQACKAAAAVLEVRHVTTTPPASTHARTRARLYGIRSWSRVTRLW